MSVALWAKQGGGGIVDRQDDLGLVRGFEPPHHFLSPPHMLVRRLGAIVQSPVLSLFDPMCNFGFRGRVGP